MANPLDRLEVRTCPKCHSRSCPECQSNLDGAFRALATLLDEQLRTINQRLRDLETKVSDISEIINEPNDSIERDIPQE